MSDSLAPDYGLDAPAVVRNLFLCGAGGLVLWLSKVLGWWPAQVVVPIGSARLLFPLDQMGLLAGALCLGMGVWMIWTSKVGKRRERETLLDLVPWTGREQVLDVGCGRGLMLVGAAKRLTTGKATGVDIWQAEDLSGNRPEATLENARREGVADRVAVETADMRQLPFPDGSFDVVVSKAAIHNLYAAPDRAQAIAEIARVLKPGGRVVVDDIRHGREYVKAFRAAGCARANDVGSPVAALLLVLLTWGSLRPARILVEK
ncbi:MAG TPA: class I SAM-dependent methyltransferase [Thermoanaerobaculia bacterium]|nr:class I SAM-dependent methyltransferase [Thermoanaerobaculia bacterium]